jgi:hypothetical protein
VDGFDRNIRALRASTTARSLIIGYGIAAFSFLMLRSDVSGVISPGIGMFVAGIVIQIAVWIANVLVKRRIPDVELAAQWQDIIAMVADGSTVILFAIGTFREIGRHL